MRKIGACAAIAALTAAIFASSPAAAFGLNLGPFHLGLPLPFLGHRHRYRDARRPTAGLHDEASLESVEPTQASTSALLYPALTAPAVLDDVFWPSSSPWPFSYDAIVQTAFAKARPDQSLCQQPDRINTIAGRIQRQIRPAKAQMQQLQRLGGALNMASAYLAKTCPNEIPDEPAARMQMMEWQIEKVAEALDIVRQPLQDFEQSLTTAQRKGLASSPADARMERTGNMVPACAVPPTAVDQSIERISLAVEPSDAQRDAMTALEQAFDNAASQLDASCPTGSAATPLARLEATEALLDATWRAAVSIQVALAGFESGLSEEQRTRLDDIDFAAAQ
jgi:hypothetical protein